MQPFATDIRLPSVDIQILGAITVKKIILSISILLGITGCGSGEKGDSKDKDSVPSVFFRECSTPTSNKSASTIEVLKNLADRKSCEDTEKFLLSLKKLNLTEKGIESLEPLSGLTHLVDLDLESNKISDISPLSTLSKLKVLSLRDNQISDISSISKLSGLLDLYLDGNLISDLSPVENLTGLEAIGIGFNNIVDLSPIARLKEIIFITASNLNLDDLTALTPLIKLKYIHARKNNIKDLSSLEVHANLDTLVLDNNQIESIFPIREKSNIKKFSLKENPLGIDFLKDESNCPTDSQSKVVSDWCKIKLDPTSIKYFCEYSTDKEIKRTIEALIDISSTNSCHEMFDKLVGEISLDLSNREIVNIYPLKHLVNLETLILKNNKIEDLSPLQKIENLSNLDLSGNRIKTVNPIKELKSIVDFQLDSNPLGTSVLVTEENCPTNSLSKGVSHWCNFKKDPTSIFAICHIIEDKDLKHTIESLKKVLNKKNCLEVFDDIGQTQSINLFDKKITNILPFKHFKYLETLFLSKNNISDISHLKDLKNLKILHLDHNKIKKISFLGDMNKLISFNLFSNPLGTDIQVAPENCPSNQPTSLVTTWCTDEGFRKLRTFVSYCSDPDLDGDNRHFVDKLIEKSRSGKCEMVAKSIFRYPFFIDYLSRENIKTIKPIENLIFIPQIDLSNNLIADFSPLKYFSKLKKLNLNNNYIQNIEIIKGLKNLEELELDGNKIDDIQSLIGLEKLNRLSLGTNKIVNIKPIASLKKIEWLDLNSNKIKDISSLKHLRNIKNFYIILNPLGDTEVKTQENCPKDAKSKPVADWCRK